MSKDSFIEKLDSLISSIFSSALSEEKVEEPKVNHIPQTIEEYTELTGKRFRMTKAQKEFGMSRQEAFEEFINLWSVGKKTK